MTASSQSLTWHSESKTSNKLAPSQSLPGTASRRPQNDGSFAVAAVEQRVADLEPDGTLAADALAERSKDLRHDGTLAVAAVAQRAEDLKDDGILSIAAVA